MAQTRLKTWIDEFLTAADLNGEFDNILTTGDQSIGTPRTALWDMNDQRLDLDADNDTSIRASSDDVITFEINSVDLFAFDGTAASPTNDRLTQ